MRQLAKKNHTLFLRSTHFGLDSNHVSLAAVPFANFKYEQQHVSLQDHIQLYSQG